MPIQTHLLGYARDNVSPATSRPRALGSNTHNTKVQLALRAFAPPPLSNPWTCPSEIEARPYYRN
jgi:hypothetical protein